MLKNKMILRTPITKFIVLLCSLCFAFSSLKATGIIKPDDLVEEGWRYHGSLVIDVQVQGLRQSFDLVPCHNDMANILDPYTQKSEKEDRYSCLFRFTSIFVQEEQIRLGQFLPLTDAIFSREQPGQEIVFLSGFQKPEKNSGLIDLELSSKEKKRGIFCIQPPILKKNSIRLSSARPLQRVYIDPNFLDSRINFRYPEDLSKTFFSTGYYDPILQTHRGYIQKEFKDLGEFVADNARSIDERFKKIDAFKKKNPFFHSNPKANSYTCAEQAALDFLCDQRVIKNLQAELNIEAEEVKGIIVNVHCSHTPCHSCATALGRESEDSGVLQTISGKKPVFVIVSCQKHYTRPEFAKKTDSMIPYEGTKFLEGAACLEDGKTLTGRIVDPISINIGLPDSSAVPGSSSSSSSSSALPAESSAMSNPYPVVPMFYNSDGSFTIDSTQLLRMIKSIPVAGTR